MFSLLTIGGIMSSCRKVAECILKLSVFFLYIIIYLLTPQMQYMYTKTCQSSQWHIKCTFMPLNVLSTPIPFGIRNGVQSRFATE